MGEVQQKIRQDSSAGQHVGFNGIDIQAVTCQFCLATSRGEGCGLAGWAEALQSAQQPLRTHHLACCFPTRPH